jgi:hypothetical protein
MGVAVGGAGWAARFMACRTIALSLSAKPSGTGVCIWQERTT